ncbi:DinB family protein [Streptomyces sp. NPDC056401]|uniref:DinB family protein n=1 Tax=Streptomyces sp. NPDC056401 TaxID=3345809 RepID=UPI0035E1D625
MAQISMEVPGDERGTLLAFVEAQRTALREAAQGLTEEQAASKPSASELSLSGLLKHAAGCEEGWLRMAQGETEYPGGDWADGFRLVGDETMTSVLAYWDGIRQETEAFIAAVPSLDDSFPLPPAPWFPQDAKVSMRWMLLHLVEEFARHAGHADIIRETIDGTRAMG